MVVSVPWWLTWVVLPLLALFVLGWIIGLIVKVVFYLVFVALVVGGLWYLYRRGRASLTR